MEVLTTGDSYAIMILQHKRKKSTKGLETEEEQRSLLCCNKGTHRCSSLGFNPNNVPEDVALNRLASILVDIFLDQKQNEFRKQTSSDLLPGVYKRTG